MDHHYYYHHHDHDQQQLVNPNPNPNPSSYVQVVNPSSAQESVDRDRDRFPQWSHEETKEFLNLRSEFDKSFVETKRNKSLWEAISAKLQLKGFSRTPDQCKSKWKNLVTRFKGSESMELEANNQFPFHDEVKIIFSKRMERMVALEKEKGKGVQVEEWEDDDKDDNNQEEKVFMSNTKKRKVERNNNKMMRGIEEELENVLREFMKQQLEIETKWMKALEARESERRLKEQEWRRVMEALQRERMELERRWREREDERQAREEERAERRHDLFMAILNKLEEKGL